VAVEQMIFILSYQAITYMAILYYSI